MEGSVPNEVIAVMKRLWPNTFVWETVPHGPEDKLKEGLATFVALENCFAPCQM